MQKREAIQVDTSEHAKRLDVSGADGVIVIAVGVNVILFMILFSLS
jgi:hypothetical protein